MPDTNTIIHDFSGGDWERDLNRRECEVSGCNCGQDECLPARQLNDEVEIHKAREVAVAEWSEGQALANYYKAFAGVLRVRFGGDR